MRFEQWLALVRTRVVLFTLAVAWALSFLTVRQTVWLDWMALVLLFWTVYQPKRISLLVAFVLGIVVDVQAGLAHGRACADVCVVGVWHAFIGAALAVCLGVCTRFVCNRDGFCDSIVARLIVSGLVG